MTGRTNGVKVMTENIKSEIIIREMRYSDVDTIYQEFDRLGWHPKRSTYEMYYREAQEGKRDVFVAEYQGQAVGYATLLQAAGEGPFEGRYPEIKDFNVFPQYRGRGIGNLILDAAEETAGKYADTVTLAVGLHAGYGAAQRIYVKRGYIPDGSGVWYGGRVLPEYADCCNDDDLNLFLSKQLR